MQFLFLSARLVSITTVVLMMFLAAPAWAQRTGDHIVPAIETVCDGDPFSFGLCNAYCEALDCDSETPLGTERSCSRILNNYMKKSDGAAPPCEAEEVQCPCAFDVAGDFAVLAAGFNADPLNDFNFELDPQTYTEECGDYGPDGEFAFGAEAYEGGDIDTPQGVQLYLWINETGPSCETDGGALDGANVFGHPGIWEYEQPRVTQSVGPLSPEEAAACQTKLQQLCDSL